MRKNLILLSLIAALSLGVGACKVEQTREGELPDVDVEGGQMPEYDVQAPDVDVQMKEKTVEVPDVDVGFEDDDAEARDRDRDEDDIQG